MLMNIHIPQQLELKKKMFFGETEGEGPSLEIKKIFLLLDI